MKRQAKKISPFIIAAILFLPVVSAYAGLAGNALQFDGNNDFATIPDASHLRFGSADSFTIELWFNPTATNRDEQRLLGKRNSSTVSGPAYAMRLDDATALYVTRDDAGNKKTVYTGATILPNN
ncbi:MAG: LamG domain-containing protein [Planctomycetes bacterium]|nr:LamG domain-containing protein [Planctomycetota bacterium]